TSLTQRHSSPGLPLFPLPRLRGRAGVGARPVAQNFLRPSLNQTRGQDHPEPASGPAPAKSRSRLYHRLTPPVPPLTLDPGPDRRLDAPLRRPPMSARGIGQLAHRAAVAIDPVPYSERTGLLAPGAPPPHPPRATLNAGHRSRPQTGRPPP